MVRTFDRPQNTTPFGTEKDNNLAVVPPRNENDFKIRYQSQVIFGDASQVSANEIREEAIMARNRNQYAGRTNHSNVVLTDEVRWGHQMRQRQPGLLLTDQLPPGAGQAPPQGYFMNANGQLQEKSVHAAAAARSQITNSLFGGHEAGGPPLDEYKGRARVAQTNAQHTSLDAIVFGHQQGSVEAGNQRLLDIGGQYGGRRKLTGPESHIMDEMAWNDPTPSRDSISEPVRSRAQQRFDANGDGVLDYGEFRHPVRSVDPYARMADNSIPEDHYAPAPPLPPLPRYGAPAPPPQLADYTQASQHQQRGGGPPAGQLLYDAEQRQWVTREGQPARFDPLLRGGAVVQQPSAPPLRFAPSGGNRNPKSWLKTTSQAANADLMANANDQPSLLNERNGFGRAQAFSRNFAQPTGGGGFN